MGRYIHRIRSSYVNMMDIHTYYICYYSISRQQQQKMTSIKRYWHYSTNLSDPNRQTSVRKFDWNIHFDLWIYICFVRIWLLLLCFMAVTVCQCFMLSQLDGVYMIFFFFNRELYALILLRYENKFSMENYYCLKSNKFLWAFWKYK